MMPQLRAGAPPPANEKPPAAARHGGLFEVNTARSDSADNANTRPPCKVSTAPTSSDDEVDKPPARVSDTYNRFDWNDPNAPVVVQQQGCIACYWSERNQIVIRRQAEWPHEEEDSFIIVNPESLGALVFDLSLKCMDAGERGLSRRGVRSLIGQLQALERQIQEDA